MNNLEADRAETADAPRWSVIATGSGRFSVSAKTIPTLGILALFALIVASGTQCPLETNFPGGGLEDRDSPTSWPTTILLEIINDSNVNIEVVASFYVGSTRVRNTTRTLPATGTASSDLLVPTFTDSIHILAREIAPTPSSNPAKNIAPARPGDVLADRTINILADTQSGVTIRFIIHPLGFMDCNFNNNEDALDISDGTCEDCNSDGVPDECEIASDPRRDCNNNAILDACEIATNAALDCNTNAIIDACDIADGTSDDCNFNQIPDDCETETAIVLAIAEDDVSYNRILTSDAQGSMPNVLLSLTSAGLGTIRDIGPSSLNDNLYFTETGLTTYDGTVRTIALANGLHTPVITSQDSIGGVTLDAHTDTILWGAIVPDNSTPGIRKAGTDGSTPSTVHISLAAGITVPSVDSVNNKLYFFNRNGGTSILRSNLNGTNLETVQSGFINIRGLAIWPQADLMAWTSHETSGGIYVAPLSSGSPVLIAAEPTAFGVAFDRSNCKIYWSARGDGTTDSGFVKRANLDGSQPETVLGNLNYPVDIAVFPTTQPSS